MIFPALSRRALCGVLSILPLSICQAAHASFSLTFQGNVQTLNTGGSISLSSPAGIVVDAAGNTYIADTGNNRIVEVNAFGVASVLTISGLSPSLSSPTGVGLDGSGNLYLADTGNSRVVEVSPAGAGSVVSTGGVTLSSPRGVAVDQSGDLFIADTGNNRIVEVTSGGSAAALTIIVSSGSSTLSSPKGLAFNNSGKLYIADSGNNRVVTLASGSTTGVTASILGGVTLSNPSSVSVDSIGNIYIADTGNDRIAEIDTSNNGTVLYTGSVSLNGPLGAAVDPFGTIYIADTGDSRGIIAAPPVNADLVPGDQTYSLNKSVVGFGHIPLGSANAVTLTLQFTTGSVGLGRVGVFTSGTGGLDFTAGVDTTCDNSTTASTSCSVEVSFLPTAPGLRQGSVVLYDTSLNPILTLPLSGTGDAPIAALSSNTGAVIGSGTLVTSNPYQLALDGSGNMYVGDYTGKNVTRIPAGGGSASLVNLGTPASIAVQNISGVAVDGAGNLFIGDYQNSRILVVTPGGVVSVLSISGLNPGLGFPTAMQFDAGGNLYVADFTYGRVVEISTVVVSGSTSSGLGRVVGTGSYTFTGSTLTGLAVDPQGTIYLAARTQNSSSIIKVTSAGVVSAVAIPGNITPSVSNPQGVAVDAMGNLYIVDTGHSRIVEISRAGVGSVLSLSGIPSPGTLGTLIFGTTVDASGNLYILDWTNNRIVFVNVSGGVLSFATTNQGQTSSDSPKIATVTNLGNLPLVLSADPTYTADFPENGSDLNPCTSTTSVTPGAVCDVPVKFTPQSSGSLSAGITVTDNSLNVAGSVQQVSVSGTAINPGDTTATAVVIAPSSLTNGQTATVSATVTDTTSGHSSQTPTGTVSFTDAVGSTITTLPGGSSVSLSGGVATLSGVQLSGIGNHTITATYAGVQSTYLTSNGSATATLAKATASLSGSTVSVPDGQKGSASVAVTGPYATIAAPSGSVGYAIVNASSVSVFFGSVTLTAGSGSSTASIPIPSSLAPGAYTINLTYSGDGNYVDSSASAAVSLTIQRIVPTITWVPAVTSIPYGSTLAGVLDAVAVNGSTTIPGTFTYSATLLGGGGLPVTSGSVLNAGSYTLSVTFTPADATTYQPATATSPFTVTTATPPITWTSPAAITYGAALGSTQLNASSKIPGSFIYSPSAGAVETAGVHTLSVTFTPADTTNYATAAAQVSLTVNQATPTIVWATPSAIAYGAVLDAAELNASSAVTGSFVYTPPAGTLESVGQHTLSVSFTPADSTNYTTANAQVSLTVNKATPPVTWATPGAIPYGTALTAAQLNASTTVAGTFAYTPALGAVLPPGQNTLSATFTPTDTVNYTTVTIKSTLTVNKAGAAISLVSSTNPVLLTNPVTFTAVVTSSPSGASGTVSFFDGTTLLGSSALSAGAASLMVTSLSAATHPVTAVYSGDANFATVISAPVSEVVQDYSLAISSAGGSSPSQTVLPGGTATYALQLGPSNGTVLPGPVTLSLGGLPPGATATITPQILPAGSSLTNVTLTVKLPVTSAALDPERPGPRKIPPVLWGVLLLPLAGGLRRFRKRMGRTGLLLVLLSVAGLTGCASSGFFAQSQQTYTITVTATSGTLSHSTSVTLTVQ